MQTAARAQVPTVVLVHGAWFGPWCWDAVQEHLNAAGVPTATVALSSVEGHTATLGGLDDDAAAISAVLDAIAGPVVLVGHSYGGIPVTQVAAARDEVVHVVYVTAFVVPQGSGLLDSVGGVTPSWWIYTDEAHTAVMPDSPILRFFGDCDAEIAEAAAARLRPHSVQSVNDKLDAESYGRVPAAYVVGERDQLFPPIAQRGCAELAHADQVTLEADHCPMLSRPADLAAILADVVSREGSSMVGR